MKNFMMVISIITALVATSGCATLADAKAAKGTGSVRIYDKPYDVVWKAVIEVINISELDLISDDVSNGQILAQNGVSLFSYGENVAIFVEKVGGKVRTRVEVINKRAMSTNVFAADWEKRILSELDERL